MTGGRTDKHWEKFGATDPYFGVLTWDKFHKGNLTKESREEFFRSGSEYIDAVMKCIRAHLDPAFSPKNALDFGCGVGRLTIPLARISKKAIGVDVSESMLREARKNCADLSVENAEFHTSDDSLSFARGKFDLIHSFIVFQHIPVKRGERIFKNLLALLSGNGVCVLHFTYAKARPAGPEMRRFALNYLPFARPLINILRGKPPLTPVMHMHDYNVKNLLLTLQNFGVRDLYAQLTDHAGTYGISLYFRGPTSA